MATSTRILSLNLGSQTIGLAEFRAQPHGGLVLQGYRLREVLVDPTGEGMQQSQIAAALREMLDELRIKEGEVNYAVAAQSVFARFVKLPAVEEEKIGRIIAFEAQQNVPFPIDEVVWDYQLVGAGTDEQVQVVLVAIKSDLLEEINTAVESTGLRTSIVDVATMSLYNAFRYNYSDSTGCSLLVDIGARTTNLLFIEPAKIFSRSVPIGGSSVTAAIAKEFGEPFAAAEFRKKRDGFVSLGGAYIEPEDVDVARVSKIMRTTMTRLHAELMRSISHYRAQQQGNPPERVFLCGGSASMTYMREFFNEKLQLPIEFFNPLRNVAVADSAPVAEISHSAHLLGELVGLALRTATTCPMELNLRPASVVKRQELEKRRPFFMVAAACFVLGLLAWGIYYTRAAQATRQITERTQQRVDTMRAADAKIDNLRKQIASNDAVATPLIGAISDRSFWVDLLEELNARLPKEDIWITELIPTSGGKPVGVDDQRAAQLAPRPSPAAGASPVAKTVAPTAAGEAVIDGVLIRGLYLFNAKQQEVVVDYFRNLATSPFFNVDVKNQSRYIKPTTPNNTEWAFPVPVAPRFEEAIANAMNWFQTNRWLGRFLIAFGIGTLLALWFLFHAKGNFGEAKARFDETVTERNRLERRDPFPSDANYAKLKTHIDNYGIALKKFEEELKNHAFPAAPLAPNEFQTRLRQAMVASAEKARANKVKLPNNFALGFDEFTAALPNNDVAPLLGQELAQAELLMSILVEARVDSVTGFARKTGLPTTAAGATPAPAKKPTTPAATGPKVIERNVVDLTFVSSPSAARKVLNQIASSNQQLYVIRTLHVRNEKEKGPAREGNAPGAPAATPPPANAPLNFIVGNEHIETSARIEMLRFNF